MVQTTGEMAVGATGRSPWRGRPANGQGDRGSPLQQCHHSREPCRQASLAGFHVACYGVYAMMPVQPRQMPALHMVLCILPEPHVQAKSNP